MSRYRSPAARARDNERSRQWRTKYVAKHGEDAYRRWLWEQNLKRYGMTPEQHDELLLAQKGRCAICQSAEFGGPGSRIHVDHCHATGEVRGLLCHICNTGLGFFKDDPELLEAAISYLNGGRR